jgi:hypothetical protein
LLNLINFFEKFLKKLYEKYGDWGLGIGDWGLGIGDWAQSPIPNPQLPNPHYYSYNFFKNFSKKLIKLSNYLFHKK